MVQLRRPQRASAPEARPAQRAYRAVRAESQRESALCSGRDSTDWSTSAVESDNHNIRHSTVARGMSGGIAQRTCMRATCRAKRCARRVREGAGAAKRNARWCASYARERQKEAAAGTRVKRRRRGYEVLYKMMRCQAIVTTCEARAAMHVHIPLRATRQRTINDLMNVINNTPQ